jgi:hypothetical protein
MNKYRLYVIHKMLGIRIFTFKKNLEIETALSD